MEVHFTVVTTLYQLYLGRPANIGYDASLYAKVPLVFAGASIRSEVRIHARDDVLYLGL